MIDIITTEVFATNMFSHATLSFQAQLDGVQHADYFRVERLVSSAQMASDLGVPPERVNDYVTFAVLKIPDSVTADTTFGVNDTDATGVLEILDTTALPVSNAAERKTP